MLVPGDGEDSGDTSRGGTVIPSKTRGTILTGAGAGGVCANALCGGGGGVIVPFVICPSIKTTTTAIVVCNFLLPKHKQYKV